MNVIFSNFTFPSAILNAFPLTDIAAPLRAVIFKLYVIFKSVSLKIPSIISTHHMFLVSSMACAMLLTGWSSSSPLLLSFPYICDT